MMKKIFTMAALALLMTACSNDIDELQAQQQPANSDGMITITAKLAPKSEAGTRAVTPGTDSNGKDIIKVKWAVDEYLAILYEVNSTKYEADARISYVDEHTGIATIEFGVQAGTADDTPCTIVYPKSAAKDDHSGVKDAATLLAAQDGTLKDDLDVRIGAGTIIATTPNLIVTTQPAAQFAIVKFSLTDGTNALAATQFIIKDGSNNVLTTVTPSPAASSTLYVAMAPATASAFKFEASDANYTYTYTKASATLAAGTYYQSSITLSNMNYNPLWWMAQYNMAEGGSSFVTSHSTESQYCFNFTDACAEAVANYHLPTCAELTSILPCNKAPKTSDNIFQLAETLDNPKEFSEITCTVGGSSVSANTSVIGKNADADYYAVRFIGTQYASAWHYKWVTSPCNGLLIESYLISGGCADVSAAKTILAGLASSTIFTGSANSSSANQTPETTTVTANAFTQRFLPACGAIYSSAGSGIASSGIGIAGNYSSATEGYSSTTNWICHIDKNGNNYTFRGISSSKSYGNSVRLFRDN
jgi:hypothetical protein